MIRVFLFIGLLGFCFHTYADEYILKTKGEMKSDFFKDYGITALDYHSAGQIYKVEIPNSKILSGLQNLKSNDQIEYVIPNVKIQIEPMIGEEMDLKSVQLLDQWSLPKIRMQEAWQKAGNLGSRKIVVAVIDTGVDVKHPALAPNIVPGFSFTKNNSDVTDKNGHGTHCAGVIGATGLVVKGVVGVMPVVSIMPLQFIDANGLGNLYTGIKAIDYAIEKKVDVISASWGVQVSEPGIGIALKEAAERADRAGVIFVNSTGNANRDNDVVAAYPANANTPSMLAVAATGLDDVKIPMSNYGLKNVHIAAPGFEIISTFPKGKYKKESGTSMATPMVAGLVAFMKAQRPELTGAEIRKILQDTGARADIQNACRCRIDAAAAISAILN